MSFGCEERIAELSEMIRQMAEWNAFGLKWNVGGESDGNEDATLRRLEEAVEEAEGDGSDPNFLR